MARPVLPVLVLSVLGPVPLDRAATTPVYRQLYHALRQAILDGRLRPGERLPPTRTLAEEWRVSRNTVMTAFDLLLAEGYIAGRVGSGTFVASALPEVRPVASPPGTAALRRAGLSRRGTAMAGRPPWQRQNPAHPFALGHPALDAFPFDLWAQMLARATRTGGRTLAAEPEIMGYPPLRAAIADYLRAVRAVQCAADQVMVVSGAQQALDLLGRLLLDQGDAVWIEEPGWRGIRAALHGVGAHLVPVPVDDEGIDVDEGERRAPEARAVLVTPSHQFPLGITMSLARRLRLLDWAARRDAWIIEDDYDSEFRYDGPPLAALQGLDRTGRVIYVGSFSKVMFPGLRLGYVVLPADLVDTVRAARSFLDGGTTVVTQAALHRFMAEGHFASHLRRMRALYAERRAVLLDQVARHLGGVAEPVPGEAGMHVVVRFLTDAIADRTMAARAHAHGLFCPPLSDYYLDVPGQGGLVLGFAAHAEPVLTKAVATLARIVKSGDRGKDFALFRN